jgi:uncharacterized protein with NRDE domain
MCLLALAWKTHPDFPLILAGNRDERHARASAAAGLWSDAPQVLAGRDLEAGGTWLGATTDGRFAVVTNYREGLNPAKAPRSRGALTADFLTGSASPQAYVASVRPLAHEYGAFSLVCGDGDSLWYFSNRGGEPAAIAPGIHALSNHLLDTPWPKVQAAKTGLKSLLDGGGLTAEALFHLLADRAPAQGPLPDTGIGAELERRVSAAFVQDPVYGTRCSTLLLRDSRGAMRFAERRFDASGESIETRLFQIEGGVS